MLQCSGFQNILKSEQSGVFRAQFVFRKTLVLLSLRMCAGQQRALHVVENLKNLKKKALDNNAPHSLHLRTRRGEVGNAVQASYARIHIMNSLVELET